MRYTSFYYLFITEIEYSLYLVFVVLCLGLLMTRVKISVSLSLETVEWLAVKVKDGTFPTVSACVEHCIDITRKRDFHG
jgi:hypothetical protein